MNGKMMFAGCTAQAKRKAQQFCPSPEPDSGFTDKPKLAQLSSLGLSNAFPTAEHPQSTKTAATSP